MAEPTRVLFVCLGNICRSPLAEVIVRHRASERRLDGRFEFASAGTGSWHVGGGADPRSAEVAARYGLDLGDHCAQQVTVRRIPEWDWFVAMDRQNRADLIAMGAERDRVLLMRQFEQPDRELDVPDPYFGGGSGFEDAYRMLQANAVLILDYLERTG
ncbi:MAG TPA: low molecular weight protein-tyrosine-phosphatase [Mariprofundaceae bacterium]|nr:low molecular weight protein-tyrosine-phosphatase [Mariprofundaceae bacterium]